ncbi:P-loop containing nucleoside triphosphate hydrolase protein [Cutaneotrichosporon oleaginosum]|uniref:p-loop containing nucleoside triphosphate hydrolase protein n=1 Tax=Cutaneotrichosporon oleaginosum TaxID=879819 RepID=A0A0J0XNH9_9TREE|nr:P-loop containing nucleoside triphosphate hydrolase protein [Cutaneotrichosporon oleaginosum]KLT42676.1 P-loop containing nucleoside triphosphate hydrolase protein [Cutaneotrichosporon oleaginosum]TXT05208.1 hypothetical protein COLE_06528 [Cutaneotrichosporon oleaginosum]
MPFPRRIHIEKPGGWIAGARWSADALILALTVASLALLTATLIWRPFPARLRPADLGGLANMRVHRVACVATFLAALASILLHLAPDVVYTLITKRSPPPVDAATLHTGRIHLLTLLAAFISAGCMRRGPRLRAREAGLGSGFGIAPSPSSDSFDWRKLSLDMDDDPNMMRVIDYGNSSMLTFLTLGYSFSLAKKSLEVEALQQSDLPVLEEWVRKGGTEHLVHLTPQGDNLEPATTMGLVKTLWAGRGWTIFITFALETLNVFVNYIQITAIHEVVAHFESDDPAYSYLMCWGMLVGQVLGVTLSAYLWVRENYLLHNPVRMTMSSILYAKILRSTDVKAMEAQHLTSDEDQKANKGRAQVMNLLTIDVNTVASMATYIWGISNGIIQLVIGLVFMYNMLGSGSVVALIFVPIFAPISAWIAKRIYECDKGWARARDGRTGAIKEFLAGIKVIKLNGFEDYEYRRVGGLRDIETSWQRWRYTLGTFFNVVGDLLPAVACTGAFIYYTKILGRDLEPATAFVTLVVFAKVKAGLDVFPMAIDVVLNSKVALDRLKNYLNQAEVDVSPDDVSDGMIAIDNATVSWPVPENAVNPSTEPPANTFRLKGISLSLPQGKMTLVCGPLGAGKTLFLRALLGEAKVESGHIISPRSPVNATPLDYPKLRMQWTDEKWLTPTVAYAPQMSYIRHGSVRDNILFGLPFWKDRYLEVLRQCSLEADLTLLVDGDRTEVGENGINLSGGQKARINLARCVYSRARTIYLDDVLSAVDAHTAQYLIDECFRGRLLRGRTVVLVSHHVDLCLPVSDYVVAIAEGRVHQACQARNAHLSYLMKMSSPVQATDELPPSPTVRAHAEALHALDTLVHLNARTEVAPDDDAALIRENEFDELLSVGSEQIDPKARQVYTKEHQEVGHVRSGHYWLVITAAGGIGYWAIWVSLYGGTKALSWSLDYVLKIWTGDPHPKVHLDYYLKLFLILRGVWVVVGALKWVWLYGVGNVGFYSAGTKKIHRDLFKTITNAPLSFFESTPSGRLLNVFAQDVKRLDSQSADDFGRTTSEMLRVIVSAITVSFEAPAMLVVLIAFGTPLLFVTNKLGKLRSNLRRLAAVSDSPIISLYHDSIDGVVMLRAFGLPAAMTQGFQVLANRSRVAQTWNWIVYNWVRAVVLTLSSVFLTVTGFILVGRDISPALAGFILNFAAQVSVTMFSLLERFIMLEQTFVSAERINYYLQNTPQEPTGGTVPPAEWPQKGGITVRDLSVRYAPDLPDVLHDVSFKIEPGQRVGLVGATGSGKSTLALSLFRAVEPTGGSIEIDGLDTSTLSLRALRQRLNMVVQDGSLPAGTLRNALDISGEADDADVYDALRRVHLLPDVITAEEVRTNPFANLDTFVAAEGANFSHGQRQLLCLARALLKKSRVLVMDEATSSVDFEMDAKITQTIRECFADTTMLVIAHRLATIVAYDRVLVLDRGRVLEYDEPLALMTRPSSAFRSLCMAQGADEYERLLKLARKK